MKLFKTGITFLLLIAFSVTGCAIKTCPTYTKGNLNTTPDKEKTAQLETKIKG